VVVKALYVSAFVLVGAGLVAIAGCTNGPGPTTSTVVPVTSSSTLPAASATTVALPAISGQAASAFIPAPSGGTAGTMSATASNVPPSVPSGTSTVPPLALVRAASNIRSPMAAGFQTVVQVGVYYLITPSTTVTYPTSGSQVPTLAITFPFSVAGQAWYIATFDTANPQYGWFEGLIGCTASGSTVDCVVSSPGPDGLVPSTGYTLEPHPYAFAIYQGSS
jgi:hypothetical protein